MKKILTLCTAIVLFACSNNDDDSTARQSLTFNFTHSWNNTPVTTANFNTIQYTTENGDQLSIERLRYLVSDFKFTKADGTSTIVKGYFLIDLQNPDETTRSIQFETSSEPLALGDYANVSFTFGFDNNDNYNNYTDLNSASFNVPDLLGGGYHFMQFDGKFINNLDTEQGFNYHAIRAVDNSDPNNLVFEDTFFNVDLGPITITNTTSLEIKMNIAEWFRNPNTWDLNQLNQMLMPNFNAQKMMSENGQSVFSLGTVTQ